VRQSGSLLAGPSGLSPSVSHGAIMGSTAMQFTRPYKTLSYI
jgi:hypothetical protein